MICCKNTVKNVVDVTLLIFKIHKTILMEIIFITKKKKKISCSKFKTYHYPKIKIKNT